LTWFEEFASWVRRRDAKESSVGFCIDQLDVFQRRYSLNLANCDLSKMGYRGCADEGD